MTRPLIPLWTLIGPFLGTMLAVYQFATLLTLISTIQHDLSHSTLILLLTIGAYLLSAAPGFFAGYALGRRAPTAVAAPALLLMLLGALVTMLASGPFMLLAAQLIAGLGGGAVAGVAFGQTGLLAERRATARAGFGLAVLAGAVSGPVLALLLSTMLSWRMAYLPMIVMAVIALVATGAIGLAAQLRNQR